MKTLIIVSLLISSLFSPTPSRAGGALTTMHGITCPIVAATVGGVSVPAARLATFDQKVMSLAGPNLWVGYANGAWDIPGYPKDGFMAVRELVTLTACGNIYTIWVYHANQTPMVRYLFVYSDMKSNCDPQGQHCGNHDFLRDGKLPATFSVSTAQWNGVLQWWD